jgi:hypothetical protein
MVEQIVNKMKRRLYHNTQIMTRIAETPTGDQFHRDGPKWLSPPDPWKNHNIAREAHHSGTAKWFIQGQAFVEWKSSGSLLWVHGKRLLSTIKLLLMLIVTTS